MIENTTPEATTATEATVTDDAVREVAQDVAVQLWSASAIREKRESLKLSRADVEKATGLSGSVVWRAEQDGKTIDGEALAKIANFLRDAQPKPVKRPTPTPLQTAASDFSELVAIAAKAEHKIAEIRTAIEAAIADGKKAKRSTKDLQAILALIDA